MISSDSITCSVRRLGEEDEPGWDSMLADVGGASPFHEMGWMRAVRDVYRHRPHYLIATDGDGRTIGGLPLFEVSGPFTGRCLVSVPYAVSGGPVAVSSDVRDQLVKAATDLAKERRIRYCELRSDFSGEPFATRSHYLTFRKTLPESVDDLLPGYPKKSRAAIRHAIQKFGLTVKYGHDLLETFYKLYVVSLRRLASPPHNIAFFRRLIEEYGDRLILQVVYCGDVPIMGVISFCYGDEMQPYWAGIDAEYNRMNVSNYAYYELMRCAIERGLRVFDFGRTRKDNVGGCSFKTNQGFESFDLTYSYYSPIGKEPPDLRPSNKKFALAQSIWRRLPLPLVSGIGARVTKWLP